MPLIRPAACLGVLLAVASGLSAAGCTQKDSPPKKLTIGVGAPENATARSGIGSLIDAITKEPWLTLAVDGRHTPRLLTKWAWDDGYKKLRLTLRADVLFHDGTRLTAPIGVAALRESVKNHDAFSLSSITSITAASDNEIDIRLSEPNSFIVPDLSILSVALPTDTKVGTGPFRFVSEDNSHVVLQAFPQYFRGHPGLDEIEIKKYRTQRNAWTAMMRGDVDMLHEVSRDAEQFVKAQKSVHMYSFPRPYYIPLVFSIRNPILKRADVRRAINEALDRPALIQEGLDGKGSVSDGPIFPSHWAYTPVAHPYVYDPADAEKLLDAAGFRLRSGSATSGRMRFSFTCLVFASDSRFERLAMLIQKQLAEVGIDMKLVPLEQRALVGRFASGDFDAFLFEMAGRSLSWVYQFWRSHPGIVPNTGYVSADSALDKLRGSFTEAEVRSGVAEVMQVMHDDPPAAFIAWQTMSRAVSTRFDVVPETDRDILVNLWQWHVADGSR